MKEIEIKILGIDPSKIRKKLVQFGATKVFEGNLSDTRLDTPDRRFKKRDQLLRVRQLGKRTELCFKDARENSTLKIQEEIQVQTDDPAKTLTLLQKLGFSNTRHYTKHRESWKLGKIYFEIDSWDDVPPLLEIEAPSEEEVKAWVKRLGFTMQQTTSMTGREVEKHYQQQRFPKTSNHG